MCATANSSRGAKKTSDILYRRRPAGCELADVLAIKSTEGGREPSRLADTSDRRLNCLHKAMFRGTFSTIPDQHPPDRRSMGERRRRTKRGTGLMSARAVFSKKGSASTEVSAHGKGPPVLAGCEEKSRHRRHGRRAPGHQ